MWKAGDKIKVLKGLAPALTTNKVYVIKYVKKTMDGDWIFVDADDAGQIGIAFGAEGIRFVKYKGRNLPEWW